MSGIYRITVDPGLFRCDAGYDRASRNGPAWSVSPWPPWSASTIAPSSTASCSQVAFLPPLRCLTPDIETNRHDETDETEMSRPAKKPLFTKSDQADAIQVWGKLWGITTIV